MASHINGNVPFSPAQQPQETPNAPAPAAATPAPQSDSQALPKRRLTPDLTVALRAGSYALGAGNLAVPQGGAKLRLSATAAETANGLAAAASPVNVVMAAAVALAAGYFSSSTTALVLPLAFGFFQAASQSGWAAWQQPREPRPAELPATAAAKAAPVKASSDAAAKAPSVLVLASSQPVVASLHGHKLEFAALRRLADGRFDADAVLDLQLRAGDNGQRLRLSLQNPVLRTLLQIAQSNPFLRSIDVAGQLSGEVLQALADGLQLQWQMLGGELMATAAPGQKTLVNLAGLTKDLQLAGKMASLRAATDINDVQQLMAAWSGEAAAPKAVAPQLGAAAQATRTVAQTLPALAKGEASPASAGKNPKADGADTAATTTFVASASASSSLRSRASSTSSRTSSSGLSAERNAASPEAILPQTAATSGNILAATATEAALLAAADAAVHKAVAAAVADKNKAQLDAVARRGFNALLDRTRVAGTMMLHAGSHTLAELGASGTPLALHVAPGTVIHFSASVDQNAKAPATSYGARLGAALGGLWARARNLLWALLGYRTAPATAERGPVATQASGSLFAHGLQLRSNKPVVARLHNALGKALSVAIYGADVDDRGRITPVGSVRLLGVPVINLHTRLTRWTLSAVGLDVSVDPYRLLWQGLPLAKDAAEHTTDAAAEEASRKLKGALLGRVEVQLQPHDLQAPRAQLVHTLADGREVKADLFATAGGTRLTYDLNKLNKPTLLRMEGLHLRAKAQLDGAALPYDASLRLGKVTAHLQGSELTDASVRNLAVGLGAATKQATPLAELVRGSMHRDEDNMSLKAVFARRGAGSAIDALLQQFLPADEALQVSQALPLFQRMAVSFDLPEGARKA